MIKTKLITVPEEYDFAYFVPLGDFHVGDKVGVGGYTINEKNKRKYNEETEKLDSMINWMLSMPNAYTFGMGDYLDASIRNSIGDVHESQYDVDEALDYLEVKLKPIADSGQLVGIFDGNHENRVYRQTGLRLMKQLAKTLGVDYFPDEIAYLFWKVGNGKGNKYDKYRPFNYTMFLAHGRGGGKTPGGKLNKVWQLRDMAPADIYIMGHSHVEQCHKDMYPVIDIKNSRLTTKKRFYVASGCWLGWSSYAKKGLYGMSTIGSPRIRLNGEPEKHGWDIHISI